MKPNAPQSPFMNHLHLTNDPQSPTQQCNSPAHSFALKRIVSNTPHDSTTERDFVKDLYCCGFHLKDFHQLQLHGEMFHGGASIAALASVLELRRCKPTNLEPVRSALSIETKHVSRRSSESSTAGDVATATTLTPEDPVSESMNHNPNDAESAEDESRPDEDAQSVGNRSSNSAAAPNPSSIQQRAPECTDSDMEAIFRNAVKPLGVFPPPSRTLEPSSVHDPALLAAIHYVETMQISTAEPNLPQRPQLAFGAMLSPVLTLPVQDVEGLLSPVFAMPQPSAGDTPPPTLTLPSCAMDDSIILSPVMTLPPDDTNSEVILVPESPTEEEGAESEGTFSVKSMRSRAVSPFGCSLNASPVGLGGRAAVSLKEIYMDDDEEDEFGAEGTRGRAFSVGQSVSHSVIYDDLESSDSEESYSSSSSSDEAEYENCEDVHMSESIAASRAAAAASAAAAALAAQEIDIHAPRQLRTTQQTHYHHLLNPPPPSFAAGERRKRGRPKLNRYLLPVTHPRYLPPPPAGFFGHEEEGEEEEVGSRSSSRRRGATPRDRSGKPSFRVKLRIPASISHSLSLQQGGGGEGTAALGGGLEQPLSPPQSVHLALMDPLLGGGSASQPVRTPAPVKRAPPLVIIGPDGIPVKRGRGRPRKKFRPEDIGYSTQHAMATPVAPVVRSRRVAEKQRQLEELERMGEGVETPVREGGFGGVWGTKEEQEFGCDILSGGVVEEVLGDGEVVLVGGEEEEVISVGVEGGEKESGEQKEEVVVEAASLDVELPGAVDAMVDGVEESCAVENKTEEGLVAPALSLSPPPAPTPPPRSTGKSTSKASSSSRSRKTSGSSRRKSTTGSAARIVSLPIVEEYDDVVSLGGEEGSCAASAAAVAAEEVVAATDSVEDAVVVEKENKNKKKKKGGSAAAGSAVRKRRSSVAAAGAVMDESVENEPVATAGSEAEAGQSEASGMTPRRKSKVVKPLLSEPTTVLPVLLSESATLSESFFVAEENKSLHEQLHAGLGPQLAKVAHEDRRKGSLNLLHSSSMSLSENGATPAATPSAVRKANTVGLSPGAVLNTVVMVAATNFSKTRAAAAAAAAASTVSLDSVSHEDPSTPSTRHHPALTTAPSSTATNFSHRRRLRLNLLCVTSADTNERRYVCPACGKDYKNANGVKYHLNRFHSDGVGIPVGLYIGGSVAGVGAGGEEEEAVVGEEEAVPAVVAGAGVGEERPYVCFLEGCERRFKSLNGFKYHAKTMHAHFLSQAEHTNILEGYEIPNLIETSSVGSTSPLARVRRPAKPRKRDSASVSVTPLMRKRKSPSLETDDEAEVMETPSKVAKLEDGEDSASEDRLVVVLEEEHEEEEDEEWKERKPHDKKMLEEEIFGSEEEGDTSDGMEVDELEEDKGVSTRRVLRGAGGK
ncbi:hypothetical protein HDU98_004891 [Podochytrium sp. JEL0797]|nr:hypothetical protein HDU98_004891 [Podochytrium sp. JEL0797]